MMLVERMDIFRLLYVERFKPSAIAAALNRQSRPALPVNWKKAMTRGCITLALPRPGTLKPGEINVHALK
jgi:hypothetical protein